MESYGRMRKNVSKEVNSMKKFVREFSEKKNDGEFFKAEDMIAPNTSQFPNLSKLSLKRMTTQKLAPIFDKENYLRSKRKPPGGIEYLPVPLPKKPLMAVESQIIVPSTQPKVEPRTKPGRELVFITGSVQFVLKTFKLYPDLRVLYEVYGNIMKIHKGKIRFEYIIIMRSESGPVLQGFYFDFEDILGSFNAKYVTRDLVPLQVTLNFDGVHRTIIIASVYCALDEQAVPKELQRLVEHCNMLPTPLLIRCDANAHNVIWGSTDTNIRASTIRCVGQFTRQYRFHIHKIDKLSTAPPETVLSRIQNVSAFALLQAQEDRPK